MAQPWYPGTPPNAFQVRFNVDGSEWYAHNSAQVSGQINVGCCSYVGAYSILNGRIDIGAFTCIGPYFYCDTMEDHPLSFPSAFPLRTVLGVPMQHPEIALPQNGVVMGSDVWIGTNVKIAGGKGVMIGHGVVIGAQSLVRADCEPYGIYAGTPARLIRFRFTDDVIAQLLDLAWWDWSLPKIMANAAFFDLDLATFQGRLLDHVVDI